MLESLIRISEAHARLTMQKEIKVYDAIMTVILMEHCLNSGLLEELFPVIMSFERYQEAKHEVLLRLGLNPGDFPDNFIQKKSKKHKRNKSLEGFDANIFISERSEFSGVMSSQDGGTSNDDCINNFWLDSSQNSTQGNFKNKSVSQSTFSGSQSNNYGSKGYPVDIEMGFMDKNDITDEALNNSGLKDRTMEDDMVDNRAEDLIDLTDLINP